MTIQKKTYEKPVIHDLGQILTGSAQMPMGYCSGGSSPSGSITVCEGGAGVLSECNTGGLFDIPQSACQAGGTADDFCSLGTGFPSATCNPGFTDT